MSVGNQPTVAGINNALTSYAIQLRNLMRQITEQQEKVVMLGLTGLENLGGTGNGFSSVANPANPGGVSDAQAVIAYLAYMNTVAGVYFGTVQNGGSGRSGAILFDFDNQLSGLWGDN
jgi:hypothetical protein